MELSEVVKIETLVLDSDLNILASTVKEYKGYNLYEISIPHKSAFREILLSLKDMQSINTEISLVTQNLPEEKYSAVILRTASNYFVTLVPTKPAKDLLETLSEMERYAYTDQLTGALNRHAYWKLLENKLYEIDRDNLGLGVIFLDMDNLKGINSNKGYSEGDTAIAFVAKCIFKCLRKYDLLIRLGGDEFLALFRLNPTKDFTVEDMANRILNTVRKESGGMISVSIGAHYIKPGRIKEILKGSAWKKRWNSIYEDLDQKLRKAKKEGKNQAILSL